MERRGQAPETGTDVGTRTRASTGALPQEGSWEDGISVTCIPVCSVHLQPREASATVMCRIPKVSCDTETFTAQHAAHLTFGGQAKVK